MIHSMTGFARHQHKGDWGTAVWELRSVNHRYLDLSIKLPDSFRGIENDVREQLRAALGRGKVEAFLKFIPGPALGNAMALNSTLLEQLAKVSHQLTEQCHEAVHIEATRLLQWPGLLQESSEQYESIHTHVLDALALAIDSLKEMRAREGAAIKDMLTSRLTKISEHVQSVRGYLPDIINAAKKSLLDKLSEVSDKLDNDRVEQEMVYFAQRIDVAEELDRLDAHVSEINQILVRDEHIGRRLDFFMQELNREANTLGSKSQSVEQTHASVDIKVLIEQMREQVQNIE